MNRKCIRKAIDHIDNLIHCAGQDLDPRVVNPAREGFAYLKFVLEALGDLDDHVGSIRAAAQEVDDYARKINIAMEQEPKHVGLSLS